MECCLQQPAALRRPSWWLRLRRRGMDQAFRRRRTPNTPVLSLRNARSLPSVAEEGVPAVAPVRAAEARRQAAGTRVEEVVRRRDRLHIGSTPWPRYRA